MLTEIGGNCLLNGHLSLGARRPASCWAGYRPSPGSSTTSTRATTSTTHPHDQPRPNGIAR